MAFTPSIHAYGVDNSALLMRMPSSCRKIHILWKQVTEQNRRIEELEKQLQALTTIEQKIQQREKPAVIEDER